MSRFGVTTHLKKPTTRKLEPGLLAPDMVFGGMHLLKPRDSHNPVVRGQGEKRLIIS